jgi:diphthamide biosynthesis protein 2
MILSKLVGIARKKNMFISQEYIVYPRVCPWLMLRTGIKYFACFHRGAHRNCPSLCKFVARRIMTELQSAPPVLSTPDTHIFEDSTPLPPPLKSQRLTDEELYDVYEIRRTAEEIRNGGWKTIALQFSDDMLHDAPRVFESLKVALEGSPEGSASESRPGNEAKVEEETRGLHFAQQESAKRTSRQRLFILADTSYGACCVDEIAAEHVDADVVVHYGRSCLSPTARLPVVYVFTTRPLSHSQVIDYFKETFPHKETKVVLMADITYSDHLPAIVEKLKSAGYTSIFAPSVVHDPSSPLPNRTIPPSVLSGEESLIEYQLFHISDPPSALLLSLSSRLKSMYIFPTTPSTPKTLQANTSQSLRRRYALITSLTTCSIFGILVNTLSVKNYLSAITKIQAQIAAAGKKSYTFVVGKVNAAKVANFSEIGGWVVVGCWESSLIESTEFYKPIITPFELGLALTSDEERVWSGEWNGDFNSIAEIAPSQPRRTQNPPTNSEDEELDDGESAPPEFDLRTGRYVSHSRPMHPSPAATSVPTTSLGGDSLGLLIKRVNGDLTTINGTSSPGAEYLRSQRTWKGLGSDFDDVCEEGKDSSTIEQGRSGIARGYTVGEDVERR